MLLFCPRCGTQHIDAPEPARDGENGWDNPPHRSHKCHACETVWRPADVATVGVASIETHGKADTWTSSMPWTGHNRPAATSANETGAEGLDQFERIDVQNHVLRRTLQRVMARLTDLLDEDQFGNIESIVKEAGVEPPAMAAAAPADERAELELLPINRQWVTTKAVALVAEYRNCKASETEEVMRRFVGYMKAALEDAAARAAASPAAEAVAIPVEWDQDAAIEALSDFPKGSIWYEFLEEVGFDPTSGPIYVLTVQGRAMLDQLKSAYFAASQPAQADAPATIPDECAASGASCSCAPEGRHGEMQCRYCGKAQADALDDEQRDALNEAICWANDDGLPGTADQLRSILALHAQADAPAETREPVCKLCCSTGPDLPCAYPTEINRQQARRIAELESRLSVNPHPDDVAVDVFATVMKDKLAKARLKGRGGWQTCSPENLSRMLREHVEKGDPRDVANFCMMLWHHGSPIVSAPADAGSGDAIARSKRILALVDDYHEKPTSDNRTSLRKALMAEFETAPPTARVASLTDEQRKAIRLAITLIGPKHPVVVHLRALLNGADQ
ncbi:hypothetical protein WJ73_19655 [Burkholderia ubonensis]|nr:hypothetical protein WJ73_19655 [Burkholderia ubonensis]